MPEIPRSQKGVTLIELLIAITVLSVGLLSIAGMQVTALHANSRAYNLSLSTSLAQGVLEEFLARDSSDSLVTTATAADTAWPLPSSVTDYGATYTVATNTPVNGVSKITITVSGSGHYAIPSVTLVGFKKTSTW